MITPHPTLPDTIIIAIKAVPGASRDEMAGVLGERLKVRVSVAAEGGKANRAICSLVAARLGVSAAQVSIVKGATSPLKSVQVEGVDVSTARQKLMLGG